MGAPRLRAVPSPENHWQDVLLRIKRQSAARLGWARRLRAELTNEVAEHDHDRALLHDSRKRTAYWQFEATAYRRRVSDALEALFSAVDLLSVVDSQRHAANGTTPTPEACRACEAVDRIRQLKLTPNSIPHPGADEPALVRS